jgi:hypothetical protein
MDFLLLFILLPIGVALVGNTLYGLLYYLYKRWRQQGKPEKAPKWYDPSQLIVLLCAGGISFAVPVIVGLVGGQDWAVGVAERFLPFLLSGAFILLFVGLFSLKERYKTVSSVLLRALLTTVFVSGWVYHILDGRVPHDIQLDCPSGPVQNDYYVTGRVRDGIPHLAVLVHPTGLDQWFVQEIPVPAARGDWRVKIILAGSLREQFEVFAIGSDTQPFQPGDILPAAEVATAKYKSRSCIVIK